MCSHLSAPPSYFTIKKSNTLTPDEVAADISFAIKIVNFFLCTTSSAIRFLDLITCNNRVIYWTYMLLFAGRARYKTRHV